MVWELRDLYGSGAINGQGWALNHTWSSDADGSWGHWVIDLRDGYNPWSLNENFHYVRVSVSALNFGIKANDPPP